MAKKRTTQSEESERREEPEAASEDRTEETAAAEEPVDAEKLNQITEDHEADVVQKMGLDGSYFGAKAAEALCDYGAHGDVASLDRAARFIQRERARVTG